MPLCDRTQTEYVGLNCFFSLGISDRDGLANIVPILRTAEALGEDVMQEFWVWFWPLISCNLPWLKGRGSYILHCNQQVKKKSSLNWSHSFSCLFSNTCWKTKLATLAAHELIEIGQIQVFQHLLVSLIYSNKNCSAARLSLPVRRVWWWFETSVCTKPWLQLGLVLAGEECCCWCDASEAREKPSEFSEVPLEGGLTLLSCLRVCSQSCVT